MKLWQSLLLCLFSHWQQHNRLQPPRGAFSLQRAPLGNILFHKQSRVSHAALLEAQGICDAEAL